MAQLRGKGGFGAATAMRAAGHGGFSAAPALPPPRIVITGNAGAGGDAGKGAGGGAAQGADGVDPNAGQAEDAFVPAVPPLPAPVPPVGKASGTRSGTRGKGLGELAVAGASTVAAVGGAHHAGHTDPPKAATVDAVQVHAHSVRGGRKRVGDGATAGGEVTGAGSAGGAGAQEHRHQQKGQHGEFIKTSRGGAKRVVPAQEPPKAAKGSAGGGGGGGGGGDAARLDAGAAGGAGAAEGSSASGNEPPAPTPVEADDPEMKEWEKLQEKELEDWRDAHKGGAHPARACAVISRMDR